MKIKQNETLGDIKFKLKTGKITYDEAKELSEEPLRLMNERIDKIAKRLGMRGKHIGFHSIMR